MNNSRNITIYSVAFAGLITSYFILSLVFFPNYFISQSEISKPKPMPVIIYVNSSTYAIKQEESLRMSIAATNIGDNADVQTVSISFPNSTSLISGDSAEINGNNTIVTILEQNFTRSPDFIAVGEQIGSSYSGGGQNTLATYPLIQLYSRPWQSNHTY